MRRQTEKRRWSVRVRGMKQHVREGEESTGRQLRRLGRWCSLEGSKEWGEMGRGRVKVALPRNPQCWCGGGGSGGTGGWWRWMREGMREEGSAWLAINCAQHCITRRERC